MNSTLSRMSAWGTVGFVLLAAGCYVAPRGPPQPVAPEEGLYRVRLYYSTVTSRETVQRKADEEGYRLAGELGYQFHQVVGEECFGWPENTCVYLIKFFRSQGEVDTYNAAPGAENGVPIAPEDRPLPRGLSQQTVDSIAHQENARRIVRLGEYALDSTTFDQFIQDFGDGADPLRGVIGVTNLQGDGTSVSIRLGHVPVGAAMVNPDTVEVYREKRDFLDLALGVLRSGVPTSFNLQTNTRSNVDLLLQVCELKFRKNTEGELVLSSRHFISEEVEMD